MRHQYDEYVREVEYLKNTNLLVCPKYRVAIIELLPLFHLVFKENGYVTYLTLGRRNFVTNCMKMMKFNSFKRSECRLKYHALKS